MMTASAADCFYYTSHIEAQCVNRDVFVIVEAIETSPMSKQVFFKKFETENSVVELDSCEIQLRVLS